LEPVEVPITHCPPAVNTADPSLIAFPEIDTKPANSSPAPSAHCAIEMCFIADTPAGTVNELDTVDPAI